MSLPEIQTYMSGRKTERESERGREGDHATQILKKLIGVNLKDNSWKNDILHNCFFTMLKYNIYLLLSLTSFIYFSTFFKCPAINDY